jgi:hypothetical protein
MGTSSLLAPSQPLREARKSSLPTRRRRTEIFLDLPLPNSDKSGNTPAGYRQRRNRINPEIRRFQPLPEGFANLADGPDYNHLANPVNATLSLGGLRKSWDLSGL